MQPILASLLLLAPVALEPVGPAGWEQGTDPVSRRVGSLLAGAPVRHDCALVVPLYARLPSEAQRASERNLRWLDAGAFGRGVPEEGRTYLRVANHGSDPLVVPAGAVFGVSDHEVASGRAGLVAGAFGALFPALVRPGAEPEAAELPCIGVLPPLATGLLLHAGVPAERAAMEAWRAATGWRSYAEALASGPVERGALRLAKSCRPAVDDFEGTAVGVLFLVAGRPAAAHVFASHNLFRQALPALLAGLVVEERARREPAGLPDATLEERARGIAWLRSLGAAEATWSESYGEGTEILLHDAPARTVGHGILDGRRTLLYVAYFHLGSLWPGARPETDMSRPPRPVAVNGSETPPGQVDRMPRPTIADERMRERRPGPTAGNGPR